MVHQQPLIYQHCVQVVNFNRKKKKILFCTPRILFSFSFGIKRVFWSSSSSSIVLNFKMVVSPQPYSPVIQRSNWYSSDITGPGPFVWTFMLCMCVSALLFHSSNVFRCKSDTFIERVNGRVELYIYIEEDIKRITKSNINSRPWPLFEEKICEIAVFRGSSQTWCLSSCLESSLTQCRRQGAHLCSVSHVSWSTKRLEYLGCYIIGITGLQNDEGIWGELKFPVLNISFKHFLQMHVMSLTLWRAVLLKSRTSYECGFCDHVLLWILSIDIIWLFYMLLSWVVLTESDG